MVIVKNKLYVARDYTNKVNGYNTTAPYDLVKEIEVNAAPKLFQVDSDENIWVSLTSGPYSNPFDKTKRGYNLINTSNNTVSTFVKQENITGTGDMAIDNKNGVMYITGGEYDSSYVMQGNVYILNLTTKAISESKLALPGLNGIAFNKKSEKVYILKTNGSSAGKFFIYDKNMDTKEIELEVGISPRYVTFY